jgi:Uma2 family endonuclease
MSMFYSESMSYTADGPQRHRYTLADYHRMGETGILAPDARVELIDGEIVDMPPPGSLHAGKVNRLTRLLQRAVGDDAVLLVQNPIVLGKYSAPQPDLALAMPRADFYESRHPGPDDVVLVVEVADTSWRFDRDVKVRLYAAHAVPEVWSSTCGPSASNAIAIRETAFTRWSTTPISAPRSSWQRCPLCAST